VTVTLQVENTARCCGAVSRGEVDVAVVGGAIPADLEHLLQVLLAVTHTASTLTLMGIFETLFGCRDLEEIG